MRWEDEKRDKPAIPDTEKRDNRDTGGDKGARTGAAETRDARRAPCPVSWVSLVGRVGRDRFACADAADPYRKKRPVDSVRESG